MRLLDDVKVLHSHVGNYNKNPRKFDTIKYLVVHYTGNVNDTARNNCVYYSQNLRGASAHFYVDDTSVWQSVFTNYAAYAVGLGSMKKPYIPNPPMYKKITNSNSISVEICGSKTSSEGSDRCKTLAAMLCAELLHEYNIPPANIYRHYDVTGKSCPAWAVQDPLKWLDFKRSVLEYYYLEGEDDCMLDNDANYAVFESFMRRYNAEKASSAATEEWEKSAMAYAEQRGLINGGRPHSDVTRGELAVVLQRMNA